MASFIKYEHSPVFLSMDEGILPATGLSVCNLIAANSCEISFDAQLDVAKYIGKQAISDDFHVGGPKTAKISLSYIPLIGPAVTSGVALASTGIFNLTGDFTSGHSIRVGSFLFNQCYLDTLGVQLAPNQPLRLTASFSSYDTTSFQDAAYSGIVNFGSLTSSAASGTAFSAIHALSSSVTGQSTSLPLSKTEINIQTSCARTPVYEVGASEPRTVLLDAVTRTTTIGGENVGQIINVSGANAALTLKFAEFGRLMDPTFSAANDYRFALNISGRVNSQSISAQPGRTAEGSVSIQENIY